MLLDSSVEQWPQMALHVIEWLSTVWGGWHSLLIPTDGNTVDAPFWWHLERFDPDFLYRYQRAYRDLERQSPSEFSQCVEHKLKGLSPTFDSSILEDIRVQVIDGLRNSPWGNFDLSKDLIKEIQSRLAPFAFSNTNVADSSFTIDWPLTSVYNLSYFLDNQFHVIEPQVDGDLLEQLCVFAYTGKLPPTAVSSSWPVNRTSFANRNLSFVQFSPFHGNVDRQLVSQCPGTLSLLGCEIYYRGPSKLDPSVVVLGDELSDFCFFYNCLRTVGSNCFWIPNAFLQDSDSMVQIGTILLSQISTVKNATDNFICTSMSRTMDEVRGLLPTPRTVNASTMAQKNSPTVMSPHELRGLSISRKVVFEKHSVAKDEVIAFKGRLPIAPIPSPLSTFAVGNPSGSHHWIAEIEIENYHPYRISELAINTLNANGYNDSVVRITADSLAYLCPNILTRGGSIELESLRPRLRLLDDSEILQIAFAHFGYSLKLSDKGTFHSVAAKRFGGYDELARLLKDPQVRNLLLLYLYDMPKSKRNTRQEGCYLTSVQRWFFDIESFQAKLQVSDSLRSLVDALVFKDVLLRGAIFKCLACRNSSWYPNEQIGQSFVCARCHTKQKISCDNWKEPEEPNVYYALDELMFQVLKNGVYVSSLALESLRSKANRACHLLPETEISGTGCCSAPVEVDFIACADGRLVIGEAKQKTEIDEHQLKSLIAICARLPNCSLILATVANEWPEKIQAKVSEQAHRAGIQCSWMSAL